MEKKLTRKEQAKVTKRNIYRAALELIETKGYENVSIEDIAQKANTAKGTFYLYFKSKQDLIYHTITMYDEIAENAYAKVKDLPTFEEQLVNYLHYANEAIEAIGEQILNALLGHNLTETEKFVTVEKRSIYKALHKIIEKGYETGELSREYDSSFYIELIVIFIQGLDYYWCNAGEGFHYVETSEREAKIFAKGLVLLYGAKEK
ncbi:TetR/AcrR family transcriptional regulator [Anaerotignum lactatifermentans]|uniref:TetR/AcrR family transcriptional regulator n=1 Tax=Anaerotignum lactatifermentans TaxID=160404 RepID=A0ABS2GCG9_9FIRM|nr:TetR/AcrR family transcriptional regulator [Anaerotignum lactatifermentans]MBM6830236.1 TetR/AcrR family transcriptional regulator [Anaerotignum lactatifermentans]MBM6878840.1 TetR/AcrR family transcriptional regulator [Anaerotignum lactatifermentans]MBM6951849.1 TetR/AcrR family transcriptional regulator [Anaerotignum lactatifermentans]